MRRWKTVFPPLAVAVGLVAVAGGLPLFAPCASLAGDAPARGPLTVHPMKDAKPGEYLRYVQESQGWKTYFIERVIDVKPDGEVYWQRAKTNEDGTKDLQQIGGAWVKVPEFKATEYQKVIKDEMLDLVVQGKHLWCRHIIVDQPVEPPFPQPTYRREVWYSNDVPCSGKVKELNPNFGTRIAIDWGMMPEAELKRRQEELHKSEQGSK